MTLNNEDNVIHLKSIGRVGFRNFCASPQQLSLFPVGVESTGLVSILNIDHEVGDAVFEHFAKLRVRAILDIRFNNSFSDGSKVNPHYFSTYLIINSISYTHAPVGATAGIPNRYSYSMPSIAGAATFVETNWIENLRDFMKRGTVCILHDDIAAAKGSLAAARVACSSVPEFRAEVIGF